MRRKYFYAHVSAADHPRLLAIAAGMKLSESSFTRMCIDEFLEEAGEPPLQTIAPRGRPRQEGP